MSDVAAAVLLVVASRVLQEIWLSRSLSTSTSTELERVGHRVQGNLAEIDSAHHPE